jgi:hypothetical protein
MIGLNIGNWLQNAGGVGTYVPLVMLVGIAGLVAFRHGSATHFTFQNMLPTWNWDTVNFWSQIAFAFTGLELVSAMSEEVRDPRRTLPRAVFGAGALIALMYRRRSRFSLRLRPTSIRKRCVSCHHLGSIAWRRLSRNSGSRLVTVGNAGGVGSTVAGIARVPFVVGIIAICPRRLERFIRWKTPYVAIRQCRPSPPESSACQPDQERNRRRGLSTAVDAAIILLHSLPVYVCGCDQAGVPQGSSQ